MRKNEQQQTPETAQSRYRQALDKLNEEAQDARQEAQRPDVLPARPGEDYREEEGYRRPGEVDIDFTYDPSAAVATKLKIPAGYVLNENLFQYRWTPSHEMPVATSNNPVFGMWVQCRHEGQEITATGGRASHDKPGEERFWFLRKEKWMVDAARRAKEQPVRDTAREIGAKAILGRNAEVVGHESAVQRIEGHDVTLKVMDARVSNIGG